MDQPDININPQRKQSSASADMSMLYGVFLTMTGFVCSLAPEMIASPCYTKRVYIMTLLFDSYVYVTASLWLLFLFLRILTNSPRGAIDSETIARCSESEQRNSESNGFAAVNSGFECSAQNVTTNDALPAQLVISCIEIDLSSRADNNMTDWTFDQQQQVNCHDRIESVRASNFQGQEMRTERSRANSNPLDATSRRFVQFQRNFAHLSSVESTFPSFYLRIGILVFGVGAVTSQVFYLLAKAEEPFYCTKSSVWKSVVETLLGVVKIFFLLSQAFFVFKHSKISILKQHSLARFAQMHLIAVNLYDWVETVVQETVHGNEHHSDSGSNERSSSQNLDNHSNLTDDYLLESVANSSLFYGTNTENAEENYDCTNPLFELYSDTMPYLAPLTIEYSLIAALSSYIIYTNIGIGERFKNVALTDTMRLSSRIRFSIDCSKSIRGLFAGILVIIFAIVVLVVSVSNRPYRTLVYYSVMDTTVIVAIVATALAYRSVRNLSKHEQHETNPDSILLLISLSGVLVNAIFALVGTLGQPDSLLCFLEVLWSVSTVIQAVFQVFLIRYSCSKRCETKEEQRSRPGRGVFLFLLLVNFALWLDHSFVSREALITSKVVQLFDSTAYRTVISITLPLLIFFRFHSTACLAELWRNVYSPPKK